MNEYFQELASSLARNHIYRSIEDYESACQRVLNAPDTCQYPPRLVMVVGAGASHAAACRLPLGKEAVEFIKEKLRQNISEELFREELKRLTLIYNLQEDDFETNLLALSKFDQQGVVTALQNTFSHKYYPNFTYEILAHLLKHRFVDAIIDFNFDELLAQAIDDEVGSGNFTQIVFDGDCPSDDKQLLDGRGRFRLPLYIKPHGTASHKSSMRFTRDSYSLLPVEFQKLFTKVFKNQTPPFDKEHLKIIVIGHAMQSIEFNYLLENANENTEILCFDVKSLDLKKFSGIREYYKKSTGFFQVITEERKSAAQKKTLDGWFEDLWHEIEAQFKPGYLPRQIERHKLVSSLRTSKINMNSAETERLKTNSYLKKRLFIELLLALAKAKGFIHLKQLARGRVGKYFRLCKERDSEFGYSLYDYCIELGLVQSAYSRESLRLGTHLELNGSSYPQRLVVEKDTFRVEITKIINNLAKVGLSPIDKWSPFKVAEDNAKQTARMNRENLCTVLDAMYDGDEVEICSNEDIRHHEIFTEPKSLPTLTALKARTVELLNHDWDMLLCVAETGEWLLAQSDSYDAIKARIKSGAKLALIVADEAKMKDLETKLPQKKGWIKVLPWWLHNQHLTLILKDHKELGGIFFERRLRSAEIAPIEVRNQHDAESLLDTFVAYWMKAERYEKGKENLPRFITSAELKKEKKKFLNDLKIPLLIQPSGMLFEFLSPPYILKKPETAPASEPPAD